MNVAHDLHADFLEWWSTIAEFVFDHPLLERLSHDRPGVGDAERPGHHRSISIGGLWRDAVDHAIGEGNIALDPPCQGLTTQARESHPRTASERDAAPTVPHSHPT